MSNVASSLLDFILNLLKDPEAAQAFMDDPQAALEDAGLEDITSVDLDDIMPVVLDQSSVEVDSSSSKTYDTGGNTGGATLSGSSTASHSAGGASTSAAPVVVGSSGGSGSSGAGSDLDATDDDGVVPALQNLIANYTYNTSIVDDRDIIVDSSVNQNIWASGDVDQMFDIAPVVANGGVAAG
jgi:hypothetical protein